jgi:hypothetical protein
MATTGQVGQFTLTSPFSSTEPATPASQINSFSSILGATVQGTVGIIQALKQPTTLYAPATVGAVPGATLGAAQPNTAVTAGSSFAKYALVGAGLALLGALGLMIARR